MGSDQDKVAVRVALGVPRHGSAAANVRTPKHGITRQGDAESKSEEHGERLEKCEKVRRRRATSLHTTDLDGIVRTLNNVLQHNGLTLARHNGNLSTRRSGADVDATGPITATDRSRVVGGDGQNVTGRMERSG